MCDIATAGLILSTAGGAYSAYNQYQVGKQNAAIARQQADQQKEIGRHNEQKSRSRMDRLIKRQRAQIASRGVRLDSASSERLGDEAAAERAIEANAQRFNTASQVDALNSEAQMSESRGRIGFLTGVASTGARTITRSLDLWPELAG